MDLPTSKRADLLREVVTTRLSTRKETDPPGRVPVVTDEPLVVIKSDKSWSARDLQELWAYRELLYFLVWRDLKVRYKQTILGTGWTVLQPLSMTLIFTVFLGWLARVPSDGLPYAIFVNAGLLPWMFFANAVTGSGNSLVGSSHLITKVYFPRMIIPAAAVGARLVDFAIAFAILGGLMVFYNIAPTRNLLLVPVVVALIALLALGVGMWTSALSVKYRDVSALMPVIIQLWMFISPVIYPASIVPARWRWAYALNPLAGIIEGFRSSVLGTEFDWPSLAVSAAVTLALLGCALVVFRRMEKSFADLI